MRHLQKFLERPTGGMYILSQGMKCQNDAKNAGLTTDSMPFPMSNQFLFPATHPPTVSAITAARAALLTFKCETHCEQNCGEISDCTKNESYQKVTFSEFSRGSFSGASTTIGNADAIGAGSEKRESLLRPLPRFFVLCKVPRPLRPLPLPRRNGRLDSQIE